jgi:hypothetical protein
MQVATHVGVLLLGGLIWYNAADGLFQGMHRPAFRAAALSPFPLPDFLLIHLPQDMFNALDMAPLLLFFVLPCSDLPSLIS